MVHNMQTRKSAGNARCAGTRRFFDAGWVGIYWPREYGGRGATLVEQYIHEEEMDRINAPGTINPVGLNIAGPTIMQWGTDEMKPRYLAADPVGR